jgi:gliding motility-associated protein GldE
MSASEVAFFGLSRTELEDLQTQSSSATNQILKLLEIPKRLLATILIVNNFVNIGVAILLEFLSSQAEAVGIYGSLARKLYQTFPNITFETWENSITFLMSVVVATALILLFGEITPKIYAQFNKVHFAQFISTPLRILVSVLRPLSGLLVTTSKRVERRLGSAQSSQTLLSDKDLHNVIEMTVSQEENTENEVDILKRIIAFNEVSAKQIMTSRVKVIAIDFRASFSEVLQIAKESEFSRFPIIEEDLDNVTGLLYTKDLIEYVNEKEDFEWQNLVQSDVMYVPETKKISDVLRDFQQKRTHLAIVVDEYGGSVGIITLEDIMEEVVGEIRDEFDDELEIEYQKIDEKTFIFEGKTLLKDVCRVLNSQPDIFDESRGDADAIAGLLLEHFGTFPKLDDECTINGYRFKVVEMDKRRLKNVQLEILGQEN